MKLPTDHNQIAALGAVIEESKDVFRTYLVTGTRHGSISVRPLPGTGETTKNRNLVTAAPIHPGDDSTNSVTWGLDEDVQSITLSGGSSGLFVLFDAVDGATAKRLLEETGGAGLDVQYDFIPAGRVRTYDGVSSFSRLDVVPGVAERVVVGAQ